MAQGQSLTLLRKAVESLGVCTVPAHGPERIAQVLLDQRYLGLNSEFYLLQVRLGAAISCYSR